MKRVPLVNYIRAFDVPETDLITPESDMKTHL